jgi:hypothetical protein
MCFTLGTAALKLKFVIGNCVEFLACKFIVNNVSCRSKVNIIRKPFLSIAVIGGITKITKSCIKDEIY